MNRVAANVAGALDVKTIDLHALLVALRKREIVDDEELRELVQTMEEVDRTHYPLREELFSD